MHEYHKKWRLRRAMYHREEIYINGKWIKAYGKERIEVINPSTEEIMGSVPAGNKEDIDNAIKSAKEAFVT